MTQLPQLPQVQQVQQSNTEHRLVQSSANSDLLLADQAKAVALLIKLRSQLHPNSTPYISRIKYNV